MQVLSLSEVSTHTLTQQTRQLWQPQLDTKIQVVLSLEVVINKNNPEISPSVEIFEIDLFRNEASTIDLLHKLGKKVICYFSAGTVEEMRPDYNLFDQRDFGMRLADWHGETYVNISSPRVWKLMKERIKLASDKGCDAIEPDNTDIYSNDGGGLDITAQDAIIYVEKLAQESRSYNMSMGLKNSQEILWDVSHLIEFAVNEECSYSIQKWCIPYTNFTNPTTPGMIPRPVYHVEYVNKTDIPTNEWPGVQISNDAYPHTTAQELISTLCLSQPRKEGGSLAETLKLNTIIKSLDLDGWMMDCSGAVTNTATR
ncbi:glycoside hydrolase superfamily [Tricladium varicosporioides]|nr:glycoside hydrolase superfamily [Hymenoscyphus varicosporioides]